VSVAREAFGGDEDDHIITVYCTKAHRERYNIVKIVIGKEITRRLMPDEEESDVNG